MLVSSGEAALIGLVQAVSGQPGFAILVFRTPDANRLFAQRLDHESRVLSFAEVDPPSYVDVSHQNLRVEVGQPALWAYVLPGQSPCLGSRDHVAEWLGQRIREIGDPLLRLQAAEFCALDQPMREAWRASFERLSASAPRSALAWRDLVILPNRVRAAVKRAIIAYDIDISDPDLGRDVSIEVAGGKLHISFQHHLYDRLSEHPGALAGIDFETRDVRDAFDLAADMVAIARDEVDDLELAGPTPIIVAYGRRAIEVVEKKLSRADRQAGISKRAAHQWEARLNDLSANSMLIVADERELYRGEMSSSVLGRFLPPPPAHGRQPLLVVCAVMPGETEIAFQAAQMGLEISHPGYRKIAIIPHLPHPALCSDPPTYSRLLVDLQSAFDQIVVLSDHSAHTRGGVAWGPSRSTQAASNRLNDFIGHIRSTWETFAPKPDVGTGVATVHLFGSLTDSSRLSAGRLVEHSFQRVSDFALDWAGALDLNIELTGEVDHIDKDELERILDREKIGQARVTHRKIIPTHPGPQRTFLHIGHAKWLARRLDDFGDICARELEKHGWQIRSASHLGVDWQIHQAGLEVLVECKAFGSSVDGRPLRTRAKRRENETVLLTNAPVQRSDFARSLLSGRLIVNFSRINVLRNIIMRRYAYLLTALQKGDHNRQLIEAAFEIFIGVVRTGGSPPSVELHSHVRSGIVNDADLRCDTEKSQVSVLIAEAARIELFIVSGEEDDVGAAYKANILLTKSGWQVDQNELGASPLR